MPSPVPAVLPVCGDTFCHLLIVPALATIQMCCAAPATEHQSVLSKLPRFRQASRPAQCSSAVHWLVGTTTTSTTTPAHPRCWHEVQLVQQALCLQCFMPHADCKRGSATLVEGSAALQTLTSASFHARIPCC
ncbi:hypothetical protein V8C86DRAFT_188934 [Haematococcus lacustris]